MDLNEIEISQLLRQSPHYFIQKVWGFRVDDKHGEMLDHLINERRGLLLCPRGHGKSKINQAFISWYILNNPNKRVILVSDSDNKAQSFLRTIKTVLESSPVIKEFYGDIIGSRWTDHEIEIKGRTEIHSEPSLQCVGAGSGAATGKHCDMLILDDVVSFTSSRSELQRERDKSWFKTTLLPVLMSSGKINVVGTRYHPNDFYDMLLNELHYESLILPAIKDETALIPWLVPLNDKLDKKGNIIQEGLLSIRENLGSVIFGMQYNNDVSLANENNIIQFDYIQYYNGIEWKDNKLYVNNNGSSIKIGKIISGVDPAISMNEKADFSAIVVMGKGEDGNLYCLDTVNKHLTFHKQIQEIQKVAMKWQVTGSVVEQVAFQESLLQELKRTSGINVIPVKPTRDKVSRLMSVSGFFENKKVHFLKGQNTIVNQLLTFTGDGGDHDDLVDACVYSLGQMKTSGSGMLVLRM